MSFDPTKIDRIKKELIDEYGYSDAEIFCIETKESMDEVLTSTYCYEECLDFILEIEGEFFFVSYPENLDLQIQVTHIRRERVLNFYWTEESVGEDLSLDMIAVLQEKLEERFSPVTVHLQDSPLSVISDDDGWFKDMQDQIFWDVVGSCL